MWLAGETFGPGGAVVFLVGQNKQFSPQLNDRNGLGMCLQGFLVFLGAGPDCITGLVTHTDCDVYHGRHSHIIYLLTKQWPTEIMCMHTVWDSSVVTWHCIRSVLNVMLSDTCCS